MSYNIDPSDHVLKNSTNHGRTSCLRASEKPSASQAKALSSRSPSSFQRALNIGTPKDDDPNPKRREDNVTFIVVLKWKYEAGYENLQSLNAILALDDRCTLAAANHGKKLTIDRSPCPKRDTLHIHYSGPFKVFRLLSCETCHSNNSRRCDSRTPCAPCQDSNTVCNPRAAAFDWAAIRDAIKANNCFKSAKWPGVLIQPWQLPPLRNLSHVPDDIRRMLDGIESHTLKQDARNALIVGHVPIPGDTKVLDEIKYSFPKSSPAPKKQNTALLRWDSDESFAGAGREDVHTEGEEAEEDLVDEEQKVGKPEKQEDGLYELVEALE
ncbi:hypothetical protein BT63DRAFT_465025 [Microthyrium microscopicum]|uniref:Zn(2)-C6 fungal-type domain-containing protein n=1 Tax=Microthyrium microscopicum TaxID=703497 RepID=A0A6A6TZA8_9PEZI|nr:hypothetical protein BT63DRAFT_465025 [Microthyrium microscopicum]